MTDKNLSKKKFSCSALSAYLSNESAQQVFFDNLVIHHKHGHLLEEDQYYPFGLTMAGISSVAPLKPEDNFKYNSKELNHGELSDGSGLEDYDYGFRNYNPQIGRFTEQDPLTDALAMVSPYQYALNDPVANIDMDGLSPVNLLCPATSGLGVFITEAGNALSHAVGAVSAFGAAITPIEGALSASAKVISLADITTNMVAGNTEINNSFTGQGVGASSVSGPRPGDPPSQIPVGTNSYYIQPFNDFKLRNRGLEPPSYYIEYGNKNLIRFEFYTKRTLS